MPTLIAYRKVSDDITTHLLRLPQPEQMGQVVGHELATLSDGRTVVVVFGAHALPEDQPKEISGSIEVLPSPLPEGLRAEIKNASPHVRLIDQRVIEQIRSRYSMDEEIKFLRIAPSEETSTWNAFVEDCRAWGRSQKAALGL